VVVKVVLFEGFGAAKKALLQLEQPDLVCRLDGRKYLFPEALELEDEGGVSAGHHTVDVGRVGAHSLQADPHDLAKHVPVESEHVRQAGLLQRFLHRFEACGCC